MKKNIVLIIRDGGGINPDSRYNAVANAHTSHLDALLNKYPNTVLEAAGTAVGLPRGYQGSSEVGHLNIGAGRIVKQEITRINESEGVGMDKILGEVLAENGLRQLRIAERQKFRHVTSFFNGKRIEPFPHEEQIEIRSMYDPALFADHPEMNAFDVTEEVNQRIESERYHLIVLNYANCDMVGHTGDFEAAKIAVEVVDTCVGAVVEKILVHDGVALVTADHGNVEEMMDYQTGLPKTSHTNNPVEFIYVANDYRRVKLRPRGILSDIAPTVLFLLGIPKPQEMTSENLILT